MDHSFRRPVEEQQLGEEQFFEGQFSSLADEVDVAAEAVYAVHVRQLKEHDVLDAADRPQSNQSTNDEDDGHVQPNDAATNHTPPSL